MIYTLNRAPSTLYSNLLRRNTNADLQSQLATAERELATGLKSDMYKSLGTSGSEPLALTAAQKRDAAQLSANQLMGHRIDTMSGTLGAMRETVQSTLEIAVTNAKPGGGTASGIQTSARAALEQILAQSNVTLSGTSLFAGAASTEAALNTWNKPVDGTGQSPADVVNDIIDNGLATAADAQARIAELDALFDTGFDAVFFGGAPGTARQSVSIGDGETLDWGVQANDPAFRDTLQGLVMLASVDANSMSAEVFDVWMGKATQTLSTGMDGLLAAQTSLDTNSARIDAAKTRMEDRALVFNERLVDLVGVDSYEAATRITALETQIQSSYAVSASLSQLSFLNFMR